MSLGIVPDAMIDSVKLEALIGHGGMGDIWQGINTRDKSRVAIKVLREEFLSSTQSRERFRREAELTEQLNSPQTLKVIKYGLTPERIPYIIMELLEGNDLQSLLDRDGPFSVIESLEIIIEILKALTEAHQLGIIHRDIKPSNLFKTHTQSKHAVKILDFGLATQNNHSQLEPRDRSLVGTYYYMSPEQAERGSITPKTDLYSVGATLYTLLTTHLPRKPTAGDKSFEHFKQPAPKLKDKNPQIKAPAKLDMLIQRCLATSPSERPESADVLRRALEQILSSISRKSQATDEFSLAPSNYEDSWSKRPLSAEWSLSPQNQALSSNPPSSQVRHSDSPSTIRMAEISSLTDLLRDARSRLIQRWTQAITERPEQSRLQSHNLKRKVQTYLDLFIGFSTGRPINSFNSFLEDLAQLSFTHPPLELIPMITTSLLRKSISEEIEELTKHGRLNLSSDRLLNLLDTLIFGLRQQFIYVVGQKRLDETNNALYRLFSVGSETPLLCTTAGVAINTHPRLRSALTGDERSGLTGRKIFEVLGGFQPIHGLYQDLRNIDQTIPKKPHFLKNEGNEGRAQEIVVYPHAVGRPNQLKLLIIIDVISERSLTEYIPSLDEFDLDYASPQALPWMMTSEVPALTPELLEGAVNLRPENNYDEVVASSISSLQSDLERNPSSEYLTPKRPIQRSGVWDNYQQQSNSVPRIRADISSTPYSLAESVNTLHKFSEDSPAPYQDSPAPYQDSPAPYQDSPAPYQDSRSSYQESRSPYQESRSPYQESRSPYQESRSPYQESRSPKRDLSSIPYEDDYHIITYENSLGLSSAIDHSISPQVHNSYPPDNLHHSAHAFIPQRSTPPIAPDTQDYLSSHSSSPISSSYSREWQERQELDSSAPTDPPKSNLDDRLEFNDILENAESSAPIHTQSNSPQIVTPPTRQEDQLIYTTKQVTPPPIPAYSSQIIVHDEGTEEQVALMPIQKSDHVIQGLEIIDHDRGPVTFNKRGAPQIPQTNQGNRNNHPNEAKRSNFDHLSAPQTSQTTPSQREKAPSSHRIPVQRRQARISAIQSQVGSHSSWMLNTVLFFVFVTCLVLLREPVTKWIKASATSQPPSPSFTPRSATSQSKSISMDKETNEKRTSNEFVTIKVNVDKATFSIHSKNKVICNGFAFCMVPTNEVIMIKSSGFYELYLTPPQLRERINTTWLIDLEPRPQ
jgi:serine/threonine protein kinase